MSDQPTPENIAAQLRQPHGPFAASVAAKMNEANAQLYPFTLSCAELQPRNQVLEIGFGNGRTMENIFHAQPEAVVTGLDFSAEMVEQGKAFLAERIQQGQVKLICGSSDAMPLEPDFFDVVFCINVIYFWEDPRKHLVEILRVLKPGGRFCATFRTPASMQQLPFTPFGFRLYEGTDWQARLENAGFVRTRVAQLKEAPVDSFGRQMELVSVCVTGEKNN